MIRYPLNQKRIILSNPGKSQSLEIAIHEAARQAGQWMSSTNAILATVESCTGGGIAHAITQIAGSSAWFDRSYVTYSNQAKQQMVGVDKKLIDSFGAVSEEVAAAMAKGGLANSSSTVCLSVTGIAGPDGGSRAKPVGTVCFGRARDGEVLTTTCRFSGDRETIRNESILFALNQWLRAGS